MAEFLVNFPGVGAGQGGGHGARGRRGPGGRQISTCKKRWRPGPIVFLTTLMKLQKHRPRTCKLLSTLMNVMSGKKTTMKGMDLLNSSPKTSFLMRVVPQISSEQLLSCYLINITVIDYGSSTVNNLTFHGPKIHVDAVSTAAPAAAAC